jgi:hypothetical protein
MQGAEQPIYVGSFLTETSAAKAHDLAALRIRLEPEAASGAEAAAAVASESSLTFNFSADSYNQVMLASKGGIRSKHLEGQIVTVNTFEVSTTGFLQTRLQL